MTVEENGSSAHTTPVRIDIESLKLVRLIAAIEGKSLTEALGDIVRVGAKHYLDSDQFPAKLREITSATERRERF